MKLSTRTKDRLFWLVVWSAIGIAALFELAVWFIVLRTVWRAWLVLR